MSILQAIWNTAGILFDAHLSERWLLRCHLVVFNTKDDCWGTTWWYFILIYMRWINVPPGGVWSLSDCWGTTWWCLTLEMTIEVPPGGVWGSSDKWMLRCHLVVFDSRDDCWGATSWCLKLIWLRWLLWCHLAFDTHLPELHRIYSLSYCCMMWSSH